MTSADFTIAPFLLAKSGGSKSPRHSGKPGKPRKPKVFLSYRRDTSSDWCGRLRDGLVPHIGERRVVMDKHSFEAGIDFKVQIREVMATCTHLLLLIRPEGLKGSRRGRKCAHDYVEFEVRCALEFGLKVIPILADPKMPPLPKGLQSIADNHAVMVRADPDFHTDVARLADHIKGAQKRAQTRKKRK